MLTGAPAPGATKAGDGWSPDAVSGTHGERCVVGPCLSQLLGVGELMFIEH